nr:hypothetical protein [Bacteroidota bacterium]
MTNRFIKSNSTYLSKRERIKDISIIIPKIRSEFYVRLYSLLDCEPEISDKGYEFFIKDTLTAKEFSAGLTGFGPGYFALDKSNEMIDLVSKFHDSLFNKLTDLKECKIEIENDFGKSVFGYENN